LTKWAQKYSEGLRLIKQTEWSMANINKGKKVNAKQLHYRPGQGLRVREVEARTQYMEFCL
jgi:hypothetical protein